MAEASSAEASSATAVPNMSRSSHFKPGRKPLQGHDDLALHSARGPFAFLNPTRAEFKHIGSALPTAKWDDEPAPPYSPRNEIPASDLNFRWTSRNNRKGRHQLVVDAATDASTAKYLVPEATNTFRHMLKIILKMFTYFPVWDVSWIVAFIFTWGSIVWVINGFFAFLPLVNYSTEFPNESLYGGGITAFIGATIFEVGSLFLMLEAVNENRSGCFGWAVKRAYDERVRGERAESQSGQSDEDVEAGKTPEYRVEPDLDSHCHHHHRNRKNLVGKAKQGVRRAVEESAEEAESKNWVWFPSWNDLKTHYFHELGFLACLSQLCGATIFWIAGFTALPGIYNYMSNGLVNGVYWTPQVIGGTGFIISGTLFMIETQTKWYLPNPRVLGWHIGLWNLVGGIGFTLSPAFGFDTASWAQYQAACSTFWGSWAFLVGSVVQLYESLEKNPVEVEQPLDKPGQ